MAAEPVSGAPSEPGASVPSGIDLTVLVPVYNEAENLEPLLTKLTSDLAPLKKRYEILVVDDGSADRTL
jgi:glycosyltransferase involved in cell wall biosynthesis